MTPGCPATGPITVRPLPPSQPDSIRWPVDSALLGPRPARPPAQPPLPWDEGRAALGVIDLAERRTLHGVRTASFGESWAEPLRADLPDPVGWSVRLASVLVEALQRQRPLGQLARWLDEPTLTRLSAQVRRDPWPGRSRLLAVHLHRAVPQVVETSAALRGPDGRGAALAFRLEAAGRRWLCTAVETPPRVRRRRSSAVE